MRNFYTQEKFIEKANNKHDEIYDYSKTVYITSTTKIIVICKKHGEFSISPNVHLQGVGCAKCSFDRKRSSQDKYIEKCKEFHGDKYDYTKTVYTGWGTNVTITCPKHGDFSIRASDHYFRGCQKCGFEQLSKSKMKEVHKSKYYTYGRIYGTKIKSDYLLDNFILDSKNKHGDRYDYSLVDFKNKATKVKIICEIHGVFEQVPYSHLYGGGCPTCRNKKSQSQFIEECSKKHNYRYDYSLVKYFNSMQRIKIICKEHGEFEQIAGHHVKGCGCPNCQGVRNTKNFLIKSIEKHGDKYDYSKTEYYGKNKKVKIICKIHGEFEQLPTHHMAGSGCSECKNSKGENIIILFLDQLNIKYKRQKTFEGCNHKKKLQFDFYLPKYNICIEFDGIQHYESIEWFGGDKAFESSKIRDEIKTDFCLNNNIKLIRIRYDDDILDKLSFLKDIYPL